MRRRLVYALAILSVLMVPLLAAAPAGAEEGGVQLKELKPGDLAAPLEPFRKMLSGRAWLITSGLDPVLGIGLGGAKEAPPSSGGGSPSVQAGGGAALVPFRDPSAKFSRNVLIPTDFSQFTYQTEPSLAVDPKDPDHILVGMIDYNFPNMVTYSSIDGGETWKGPHQAKYPRKDLGAAGDPVVAFDSKGNAFYAYISLDVEEFTVGPLLGTAVVSAISLSRSVDGGDSWTDPVNSSRGTVSIRTLPSPDGRQRGEVSIGFLDKPWMTIGPHPTDPTKDVIYVVYTKFIQRSAIFWVDELPFLGDPQLTTVIELVRSEDGGVTWSKPLEVSPRAQYVVPEVRQVVQGSDVAVAPDGTVYVAWLDSTDDDSFEGLAEVWVSRSDNAGATFERARRASGFLEPGFTARNGAFRSWGSAFPKLAVGPKGDVYLMWVGVPDRDPEDDGDVFFVRSTNKGQTWSRRIRVNDDDTSRFQFFPEMTVDSKGVIHAMWGDLRDDPFEVSYHIYYATSEDGGETWSLNSRVTDFPSNPNRAFPSGRFIGDYFAIAATEGDVYMVWADGRLGEFGGPNQKIAFARKRLMPEPSIFISPPSGPGGKDVIVQGFNFQPKRNIFVEVAGVIVSTARTQEDGRFTTQIFVPISGKGAHGVRVLEESGNVASSSFFMDFGFDTIRDATTNIDKVVQRLDSLEKASSGASSAELLKEIKELKASLDELKSSEGNRSGLSCNPSPSAEGAGLGGAVDLLLVGGVLAAVYLRSRRVRK